MAKKIKLLALGNYREHNNTWTNEIRYGLIGIEIIRGGFIQAHTVGAELYLSEASSADIIVLDIRYIWGRGKDFTTESAISLLQKIKGDSELSKIPIALISDDEIPDIEQLRSQMPKNYNRKDNSLKGSNERERLADLVGKICAENLNKSIDRNFEVPGRRIFLSHSWKDKGFARKLAKDLTISGAIVWIDEAEIKLGDSLIYKISKALDYVDYCAVLISKNSIDSSWVQKELEIAMTIEFEKKDTVVLPLILDDCTIPNFLKGKMYADMSTPAKYEKGLNLLKARMLLA